MGSSRPYSSSLELGSGAEATEMGLGGDDSGTVGAGRKDECVGRLESIGATGRIGECAATAGMDEGTGGGGTC